MALIDTDNEDFKRSFNCLEWDFRWPPGVMGSQIEDFG